MKPKILVITGPTCSGKKSLAMKAAVQFNGEIVSADSRKIYRFLNIGTAKPTEEHLRKIPHNLIDIINPDEPFSVGDWIIRASEAVKRILEKDKLPVISGGTGFYIKAFQEGITAGINSDPDIRENLKKKLKENGVPALYEKLKEIDPERAKELSENDTFRILRALEIYYSTGKIFSSFRNETKITGGDYEYYSVFIEPERKELYNKIDSRVDKMISDGLVEELKTVIEMGYSLDLTSLNTVGYKEWFPFFDNKMSFEECRETVKRNTRRYAKRQMTWFHAQKDIVSTESNDKNSFDKIFSDIKNWLEI
jgi:tRNA dimethylallyltransferase